MVMDLKKIESLIRLYRETLFDDCLPFWINHCVDREHGGFLTYIGGDGSLISSDKAMWVEGRFAWLLARLYNTFEKKQEWLELAKHGIDFILKHGFDSDGRMFYLVTRDGRPIRKRRYLFTETFGTIALAEYAKAAGDEEIKKRAVDLYNLIIKHYRTPGSLPPKEYPQTRPSKAHAMPMILLATTQILRQIDDNPLYKNVIDQSLAEIFDHFLKPEFKVLLETVGPNGEFIDTPEGRCVNAGHAIETAWFIMEEGRHRNDNDLVKKALPILEWSLEWGWDKEYGGILYFVDVKHKQPIQYEWDMKLWWPHTETMYALLLAHHLTGDKKWEDWYDKVHEYSFNHFPDKKNGEWFGYLHRDGSLASTIKGNGWKGPFHLPRTMLYGLKLLEEMKIKPKE